MIGARLQVDVEEIADGLIVRPVGGIDMRRAPWLRRELADLRMSHRPARLVIDLGKVPEMDSAAVATLVEALQVTQRDSTLLVLCGLQPRVRALFEIVRLDQSVFPIVETTDDAIALPNRRKFDRYHPAALTCNLGTVLDISAGGIRLCSRRRLRGSVLMQLHQDGTDLCVGGRVIRRHRLGMRRHEVGIQFVALGAEQARTLAAILAVCRAALRRRPSAVALRRAAA